MSLRGKHHSTGDEYLYLGCSPSQFFTRGLAHVVNSVSDHRHHGKRPRLTTWVDHLIGSAKVCAAAGLRQCAPRVEQSWANDFPFRQKACNAVVGAARFSARGETVHQATSQIIGGGNGNFGGWVGDVLRTKRQSRYMRMRIDETRHQRSAANIDHVRIFMLQGRLRQRKYAVALDQNIE